MKLSECEVGQYVKVLTKSHCPETFTTFLAAYPTCIAPILYVYQSGPGRIVVGDNMNTWLFNPEDLVLQNTEQSVELLPTGVGTSKVVEPKMLALRDMLLNAYTGVTRHRVGEPAIVSLLEGNDDDDGENNEWVSLKPITIQALEESGSCETDLHRFAMKAIEVDFNYYREPIPPSIAIDICDTLGIIWDGLVTKGFIRQKRDVFNPAAVKVCTGLRTAHIMYDGWAIASLDKNGVQLLGQTLQENVPFPVNSAGCIVCREEDALHAINL